ncbi:MAG: Ig-like domain-containing protein, partial [Coriobacteriia bacterium]
MRAGLLVAVVVMALGAAPVQAQYITIALPSFNASNTAGFVLAGAPAPFRAYVSDATHAIRLTDSVGNMAGAAVSQQRISLPADRSFSSYFTISMPNHDSTQYADGMVFVLQGVTNTPLVKGMGMGFLNDPVGSPNSQPHSLAIEFDTYKNTFDPAVPHVGVDLNGSQVSTITAQTPGNAPLHGSPWNVWADYDGSAKILQIRMSQTTSRPATPTLSYPIDLANVIGQEVYAGFTAGTGGWYEAHDLQSLYLESNYLPGGLTPATIAYSSAPDVAIPSSGATQTVAADTTQTLTATFQDSLGNAVAQMPVTFSADEGSVTMLSSVTDASGQISALYTAPSAPGDYTVTAIGAEGVATSFTQQVLDTTAPSTTAFGVPTGWSAVPVVLTLAAADDVAAGSTYYAINGGFPNVYTLQVPVSQEGTTTVTYWSVDAAGNTEPVQTATIRIDSGPPASVADGIPSEPTTSPVTLSLNAADALSGVTSISYVLDGSAEHTYAAPIAVSSVGTHALQWAAIDAAGNREATRSVTFVIVSATTPATPT